MNAAEMEQEFLILYDKITNFDAPGYTSNEISRFLTRAQERVILQRINPLGNKYRQGYERTEKRRKDLSELDANATLLVASQSVSQTGVKPNGVFYDLPADFLYASSEEVTIASSDTCINNTRIEVKPVTNDEYSKNIRNPYKKPHSKLVWRMEQSKAVPNTGAKRHELITDGSFTITEYHLSYIRTFKPIISDTSTIEGLAGPLDCELNSIIHREIIDEAVKIATGITDPQMYQLKSAEKNSAE
jgi:hypothetical protein